MFKFWFVGLVLACSVFQPALGQKPLTVSGQTTRLMLNEHFSYRVVNTELNVENIAINEPQRWLSPQQLQDHNYAGERPNVWGVVPLFNRSNAPLTFHLKFSDPYLKHVGAYLLNKQGQVTTSKTSIFSTPLLQRQYLSHEHVLPITLPANEIVWLAVSVQQWPEQMPSISFWQPGDSQLRLQQQQTALGVNAGILILLALAAVVSARLFGSRLLVSFGVMTVVFTLSLLLHSGIWSTYFTPYSPDVAAGLNVYISQILIVALSWFIWEWSRFRFKLSRFNRIGYSVMMTAIALTILLPWLSEPWKLALISWQINALLLWGGVIVGRSLQKQPVIGHKWQTVLMVLTVLSAWLLVSPRYNPIWEGLSGLLLYSGLTLVITMFLLALERYRLSRLIRRISNLERNRKFLRRRSWRFLRRTGEGWFRVNADGSIKQINRQMINILAAHSLEQIQAHWPQGFKINGARQLVATERLDGRKVWLDIELFSDNTGRIADVTKRMEAEVHLNFLAHHDAVTGLLNVREFRRLLQERLDKKKNVSVIIIRLTGLQVIADQVGSDARDQAILQLTLSLQQKATKSGRIARVSETEVALLSHEDEQAAFAQAHRLVQFCREFRFSSEKRIFQLTTHVGISYSTDEGVAASTLMRQAREAVELAMQEGDYRVHSYSEADQKRLVGQAETEWEARLKKALREEDWKLFSQPLVSASKDEDKHCFEVLLRLPGSGKDEAIAPQQFLRAALRAGVMGKADRWLVREVIQYFNEQPFEANRTWRCHINLSTQSLEDIDFIRFVEQILKQSVLQPEQLVFEVAEPDAEKYFDETYRLFTELRDVGIGTALDQFGTGFNSFRLLRQLPLTQIKVNRFWVQDMLVDAVDAELVDSCVRIAKVLGIEVCAVGVESDEARIKLTQLGVDYVQGFVCGHPVEWQRPEKQGG
ncbi:EAL domain-containing protein [Idiomarina aminovorans]|uniref:EAL domain-containing protein n=1 Tax=Idiomarina aminovorans TaxID=2914829 RepID=UPI00200356F1|nr:EAL domain-containing protein [Idiomarina sp. ATCH4]MCK7459882.1 EAL domain-containing protein [Idiomarina sp. ATCH4]